MRVFDFDKIAHLRLLINHGAGTDACIGPDTGARFDLRPLNVGERMNLSALADNTVRKDAVSTYRHAVSKNDGPLKYGVHIDTHITAAVQRAANIQS